MATTEISRYELERLDRRLKGLEDQRREDLADRRRRAERRSTYLFTAYMGFGWTVIIVVWTVLITLEVAGR